MNDIYIIKINKIKRQITNYRKSLQYVKQYVDIAEEPFTNNLKNNIL